MANVASEELRRRRGWAEKPAAFVPAGVCRYQGTHVSQVELLPRWRSVVLPSARTVRSSSLKLQRRDRVLGCLRKPRAFIPLRG